MKFKILPYEAAIATCTVLALFTSLRFSMLLDLRKRVFAHIDFPTSSDGFPRQLPLNVRNAAMAFIANTSHYGLHDVHEWESLTPPGNGWVVLEPGPKAYAVTMYHQLHCLNAMRYDLTQSKMGKRPTKAQLGHAHHCYNYIRQGLQCGLDLTLDSRHDGVGEGPHVCRDWVQIREFMEENYKTHLEHFS